MKFKGIHYAQMAITAAAAATAGVSGALPQWSGVLGPISAGLAVFAGILGASSPSVSKAVNAEAAK